MSGICDLISKTMLNSPRCVLRVRQAEAVLCRGGARGDDCAGAASLCYARGLVEAHALPAHPPLPRLFANN